jgi:two-component system sensor histidine kinase/response regulator
MSSNVSTLQGKREVLSNLRHDLRTPLNGIIGYSEMLLEDAEDGALTCGTQLHKVLRSGQELLGRVNEVLDAARLESATDIDLETYASRIYAQLRDPLDTCLGYAEMLLEDAARAGEVDALPELEKIHAASQKFASLLEDGILFLKVANGQLNAEDMQPLSGSSPAEPMVLEPAMELQDESDAAGVGARILVVDDNETNRDLLSRRLQRQAYAVTLAESGESALEKIKAVPPDLILLDIMMPGLNGYQVLELLKKHEEWRHIPVIMISALDELGSVVRCIETGADDYLSKPFNPVLLRARVRASLEKKRLRDREVLLYQQLQENFERLQELEQLRDSLTHMVVHDLRTPLTSIISGLQTMQVVGELEEIHTELLEMALSGGETLLRMINDLLDISKMEAGQLKLEMMEIDVRHVAQNSLHQVSMLAQNKGVELKDASNLPLPLLRADEDKLMRTLTNLLGNAIKFTPFGGSVTLQLGPQRENENVTGVLFAISDTGEGIPSEAFGRIFEKFGQVESRREGRKMSTGLGLTFCKMAVEAHGGRIWVESEMGKGSTFQFVIPVGNDVNLAGQRNA